MRALTNPDKAPEINDIVEDKITAKGESRAFSSEAEVSEQDKNS